MDGRDSTQSLLVLRKLTRAIADVVRVQMTEYLATLAPLLRPKMVLGDHVEDGTKESSRRSDKAFKDLQTLYESLAGGHEYVYGPFQHELVYWTDWLAQSSEGLYLDCDAEHRNHLGGPTGYFSLSFALLPAADHHCL